MAIHRLRERFDRVAYIDIDLHHGDGPQSIFYDDPNVLTCSIHESGRTLYPGTGFLEETGADFTSWNVPLPARTSGDVWLRAFSEGLLPAVQTFRPEALVLQMGADAHFLDPLGHLNVATNHWFEAVRLVRDLGIPLLALGGGGYNLTTTPRMWVGACLLLSGRELPEYLPEMARPWGMERFLDDEYPVRAMADECDAILSILDARLRHVETLW